ADRFPELAVADHVDAGLGLLAHDVSDGIRQALVIRLLVEALSFLPRAQKVLQLRRPDQAADVRGEDALVAAFHRGYPARAVRSPQEAREARGPRARRCNPHSQARVERRPPALRLAMGCPACKMLFEYVVEQRTVRREEQWLFRGFASLGLAP